MIDIVSVRIVLYYYYIIIEVQKRPASSISDPYIDYSTVTVEVHPICTGYENIEC